MKSAYCSISDPAVLSIAVLCFLNLLNLCNLWIMIELQLTDDHEALVQTVREFAQKEVAPYIKEWDETQEFHREIFDKMAALNLLGVCIPEEYGGAGFDYISLGLVCEELEAVDTFLRVAMSVHTGLNSLTLYTWGTEAQEVVVTVGPGASAVADFRPKSEPVPPPK